MFVQYSNILCGVIRGALSMVQLVVTCEYLSCELKGGNDTEIRVTLQETLQETGPQDD